MKKLLVPKLGLSGNKHDLSLISSFLDSQKREPIATAPWPEYSYIPDVAFSIAHSGQSIFLKYYVNEIDTKAIYTEINDPVYKDSCVEFFISFDNGRHYYNFEFNIKGVCLAGFGENRDARELLAPAIIKQIDTLTTYPVSDHEASTWELCLKIPVSVFCHDNLQDLGNTSVSANFYKCGDDLTKPHFLAWNQIISTEPNFHMPEYFGELHFASDQL